MSILRQLTAGESHGAGLIGILDGLVRGIPVREQAITDLLRRRRGGFGRSARQTLEADRFQIIGGVRYGMTTGNPFGILIENRAAAGPTAAVNGRKRTGSATQRESAGTLVCPRPGHADFAGLLRFAAADATDIAERASARETAVLVALSVPARELLAALGVTLLSFVARVGDLSAVIDPHASFMELSRAIEANGEEWQTPDAKVIPSWKALIESACESGDTLGGAVRIRADGLVPGLGGFSQRDERLDGRLAASLMSLPGVKAVAIGNADTASRSSGSACSDDFFHVNEKGVCRTGNSAGGLEGGMTNGEPLCLEILMKPIPTGSGRRSVDLRTMKSAPADCPRHDTTALAALATAAESAVAIELADACLRLFGGATLSDVTAARRAYLKRIRPLWKPRSPT